jgi:hypothetical protein
MSHVERLLDSATLDTRRRRQLLADFRDVAASEP